MVQGAAADKAGHHPGCQYGLESEAEVYTHPYVRRTDPGASKRGLPRRNRLGGPG